MTSVTIQNIDENLAQRLAARAAAHGRSMEAEAKDILSTALGGELPERAPDNLYDKVVLAFAVREERNPQANFSLACDPCVECCCEPRASTREDRSS